MKKLSSLLLALVLAALMCFGAVAEEVNYVGGWNLTNIYSGGVYMDPAAVGMQMYIILNEDGTAELSTMGYIEQGAWAPAEGGVSLTDASGATETLIYRDNSLVIASEGIEMILTPADPATLTADNTEYAQILSGLTLADFNGIWEMEHVETTMGYFTIEDLGAEMTVVFTDGAATIDMTTPESTNHYTAACTVEEIEELGTVLWASFLDAETGEPDGTGMMFLLYDDGQLVWYEYDSATQMEYFYCFDKVAEPAAE